MDRQLLRSSKPIGNGSESNLAVGRFERIRDSEGRIARSVLHLTPIKNVLQMETACDYLDAHKTTGQVRSKQRQAPMMYTHFNVCTESKHMLRGCKSICLS